MLCGDAASERLWREIYPHPAGTAIVSMDMAQNILVIKTVSGMAMAVAEALDVIGFHEIVGCVAGDNTIMCAVQDCGRHDPSDG